MIKEICCSVFLMVTLLVVPVWGAPSLVITGQKGNYDLRCESFDGVGAMDITIGYDQATLANPRVSERELLSGAMMVPNLTVPGIVRIGVIHTRGITGSGTLLSLAFSPVGDKAGLFTALSVTAYGAKGNKIPVLTALQTIDDSSSPLSSTPILNPAGTGEAGTGQEQAAHPPGAGVAGMSGPIGSAQGQPTDAPAKSTVSPEVPQAEVPPLPPEELPDMPQQSTGAPPTAGPVHASAPNPKSTERKSIAYASVLSRFKDYSGPKTLHDYSALFAEKLFPGVRQEPAIGISDGTATLTLYLEMSDSDSSMPKFALKNSKLLSLKSEPSRYILELLPESGVIDATITVLHQGRFTEIPLIITPRLDVKRMPSGKLDETTLNAFLKKDGTGKDLNGDGKQDYVDEYIAVANYLVAPARK